MVMAAQRAAAEAVETLDDLALAARAAGRDAAAIRLITTRNNQRLFRAAWSILKDRAEAEDVVQEAYAKSLTAISGFAGGSSLSTWLTRIVINEAIDRKRAHERRARFLADNRLAGLEMYRERMGAASAAPTPEAESLRMELRAMLEKAVADLPEAYRCVFVLRDIEAMSVAEAAEALEVPEATIKTRHWRARRLLRTALAPEFRDACACSVDSRRRRLRTPRPMRVIARLCG